MAATRATSRRPALKAVASPARPRFGVYVRISRDPDGTSTATERQLDDCRRFAELRGWDIVATYEDPDVSAFRRGVVRKRYEEMLADMAAGRLDGVLVWRLDRLVRRVTEFSRFWLVAEQHDVRLAAATQPIDTGDPVGMLIVNILVAFAEMESHTMSIRITAQRRAAADAGEPMTTRRSYGIEEGWAALVEDEARVVRDVASRLLAGEAATSIVRDLNRRGVRSPGGGKWDSTKLRALMTAPRLWGWREYHGEPISPGTWPRILDEATGRAVRDLFLSRSRPGAGRGGRRRYLLSGLVTCGACGRTLNSTRGSDGKRRYVCPPREDLDEERCGKVVIHAEPLEAVIEAQVAERLSRPDVIAALRAQGQRRDVSDEATLLAQLAEVSAKVEALAAEWAAGSDLPRAAYVAEQRALDEQARALTDELARTRSDGPLGGLTGPDPAGVFQALPVDRKRAVIDAVTLRVVAHKKDAPEYLARLRVALEEEAEEYAERARELSDEARMAGTPEQRRALLDESRRYQKWAHRRRDQAKTGTGGGRFRPERVHVDWRV